MPMEFPVEQSYMPEDLVELIWDNGQIVMQSQSSRTRNSQHFKPQDKYVGKTTTSRFGSFGSLESFLDDGPPGMAASEADLSIVDDMVPWFDDFLPETSCVTMSELPIHSSLTPLNKRSCVQTFESSGNASFFNSQKLAHTNGLDNHSSRTGPISSWSTPQGQTSVSSFVSGVSDIMSCTTRSIRDVVQPSPNATTGLRMQKTDLTLPGSSSSLPNFPFLSRRITLGRANLQNNAGLPSSYSSARETTANEEKASIATGSSLVESELLLSGSLQKKNDFPDQSSLGGSKVLPRLLGSQPPKLPFSSKLTNLSEQEDQGKFVSTRQPVIGANPNKGILDGEKTVEPVIASSSVCSGSSADRASDCQMQTLKRKDRESGETEPSDHQSEDVEEESVGVRKEDPARGVTGSKRHRAAEVHNLSERRRRERINEKMRALQELIPNCNKVDKASMLDEAIEYLKTLQLQVQMMSMGASVYMPQMMFPVGMQHIHAAHAPHFAPMGMRMGMGMGMGMGMDYGMQQMLDMNGGSPMFPAPPVQRPHFPSASVSNPTTFPGVGGPNVPNFWHPGQGHPISVPEAPVEPLTCHAPTNSSVGVNATRTESQVDVPSTSQNLKTKDHKPLQDADVHKSIDLATTQVLPNQKG